MPDELDAETLAFATGCSTWPVPGRPTSWRRRRRGPRARRPVGVETARFFDLPEMLTLLGRS
ncbi:hypothetical protein [Micromonospora chersina]|uniref:hypothetical protein n=1 Tax=Micromonospora chersina TaxID=47854 RepID=UPI003716EB67